MRKNVFKAFVCVIILLCITLMFAGCIATTNENENINVKTFDEQISNSEEFVLVKREILGNGIIIYLYYNVHTGVMYQFLDACNEGGLSVFVKSDGTPMLYEEYLQFQTQTPN